MDYRRRKNNQIINDNWSSTDVFNDRSRMNRNLGRKDSELTLMRLRRLFKTVLIKNERSRFEERKLCRTNLVTFLVDHLSNPWDTARCLALDLLCCSVPRLGNKTDALLMPILPKIFQCLDEAESKDMRLKALHFLRALFRHTKNKLSFIDQFILLGVETSVTSQASFLHGIGIIFDQDIGDGPYSRLMTPLGKLLSKEKHPPLFIAIYRTLHKIHELIGDVRFFNILQTSGSESQRIYLNVYTFEKNDPYLNLSSQNLSAIITEYLKKSSKLHFKKAFGIVDFALLEKIETTRDCERAVMVSSFVQFLKRALCNELDLECHLMDLLKLISAFLSSSNRPVQVSGLEFLKDIACKIGFHLTSHLSNVIDMLRECLTSPNSKVKSKTEKILSRLMRYIHPMTVVWELLRCEEALQKEVVLKFILKQLRCLPYYFFDLVSLSNFIAVYMQDINPVIQKTSQDCIIALLSSMRASPVAEIRAEASKLIRHNYSLPRRALRLLRDLEERDEDIDSLSDDGTTDTAPSTAQSSLTSASGISAPTTFSDVSTGQKLLTECKNLDSPYHSTVFSINDRKISQRIVQTTTVNAKNTFRQNDEEKINSQLSHERKRRNANRTGELQKSFQRNPASNSVSSDDLAGESSTLLSFGSKSSKRQWDSSEKRHQSPASPLLSNDPVETVGDSFQLSNKHLLLTDESRPDMLMDDHHLGAGDCGHRDTTDIYESSGPNDRTLTPYGLSEEHVEYEVQIETKAERSPCHVEVLDPREFNYNVLQIETPTAMGSMREVDENDEDVGLPVVLPSIVRTPGGHRDILPSHSSTPCDRSNEEVGNSSFLSDSHSSSTIAESVPSEEKASGDSSIDRTAIDQDCSIEMSKEVEDLNECDAADYESDFLSVSQEQKSLPSSAGTESTIRENLSEEEPTPWKRGRELPRTPIEKLSATKIKFSTKERTTKMKETPNTKKEQAVSKKKLSVSEKKSPEKKSKVSTEKIEQKQNSLRSQKVQPMQEDIHNARTTVDRDANCSNNLSAGSKWDDCPWQRDIDYASKGGTCIWAQKFEKTVMNMKPFATNEMADAELKKALDDLFGKSWKLKEDAMMTVIRIAKHHPEMICFNATKIIVAVCSEVKNFRQSVAGKAILTCGHLYCLLGKKLESKLRIVVAVLLMKSGNRTLAAYFRLVIQSLFKIVQATSPQKAALAFIKEGSRHPNKASRETAAQFLAILTEEVGPLNTVPAILACEMLKCAANFAFDCSAITRYCGKRMFQVFRTSPNFEKMKNRYLDVVAIENLSKVLEQIETKGVSDEILPVNIIKNSSSC